MIKGCFKLFALLTLSVSAASCGDIQFNRDIRPILAEHCFQCHGADIQKVKSGLRLDRPEIAMQPAKSGEIAVVPHKPAESELIKRIQSSDDEEIMPPPQAKRPLSAQEKEALATWISEGAKYEKHWAFAEPQRPLLPSIPNDLEGMAKNPIDRFVFNTLGKRNLQPQPEAPREKLLRRVTFDLTGLPPSAEELKAFLEDTSLDAYEKCVDRLLASSRYGENMAVLWLDLARYADSHGYQRDSSRIMWPWRDWVINALNTNMAFDQFSIEQIAGDLLPLPTQSQLVATGFNRNNRINTEAGIIPEEWRVENVIDRVETLGTTWMGLTLNCCRCHDHKYDPITQREFYQVFAFFNDLPETGALPENSDGSGNAEPLLPYLSEIESRQLNFAQANIAKLEKQFADLVGASTATNAERDSMLAIRRTSKEQSVVNNYYHANPNSALKRAEDDLLNSRAALKKLKDSMPSVMIMRDGNLNRESHILIRGQVEAKGDRVDRGTPAFLPPLPKETSSNRLGLAKWLFAPNHPLTARVWVNRAWEHFFGVGISKTVEDLGTQAELPSHLDLLNWLACEFSNPTVLPSVSGTPARAWDMKALHKLIVTSFTYRQSSRVSPDLLKVDPENRLYARGPRFRLHAEAIRDQALFLSGLLVEKTGGPSVRPYMPVGIWNETSQSGNLLNYAHDSGEGLYRRTIYTFLKRTAAPPMLQFFDAASRETCTVRRSRTNTPLQALTTLNETSFVECARCFAEKTLQQGGSTHQERVRWAFHRATSRQPNSKELSVLLEGLRQRISHFEAHLDDANKLLGVGASKIHHQSPTADFAAYAVMCSVLLNLDEVLTRE